MEAVAGGKQAPGRGWAVAGVSHAAFGVQDLVRSIAFYRDVLGMVLVFDTGVDVAEPKATGLLGTFAIEFAQAAGLHDGITSPSPCLSFVVDDIDACLAALCAAGGVVPECCSESFGARFFQVRDPDGHWLELIQFPARAQDLASYLSNLGAGPQTDD
jgi:catechol 2,3-dioxygenase-like lactoylglutathione lyase family enzyme